MRIKDKKPALVEKATSPFQRLQGELARLIAKTSPGDKLPSEPGLARQLGVSRATLREAMRAFEGQGVIRRRQGVGTFVVERSQVIETGLEILESIESLSRRIGLDVSMGVSHIDTVQASSEEAEGLGIASDAEVVRVSRVILAGTRPVAFLVDTLPKSVLSPDDLALGFTGSVLDLLLRRGDVSLTRSVAEIQAVAAAPEIARALGIQRGDVLLMVTARLFTAEELVVDYSLSYFLPGYFRFHVVRRVGEIQ